MNHPQLHSLESKVDQLLQRYAWLEQENHQLREAQSALQADKQRLLHQNALARDKITAMIARLKALELNE